jgi:RHS repeat-associated protein
MARIAASSRVRWVASVLIAVAIAFVVHLRAQTGDGASADAPTTVTVNRTVPQVTAPSATLTFSRRPTKQEIFRARVFAEPLVPVGGEPTDEDTAALANALLAFHVRSDRGWIAPLGIYLTNHPDSPWRASLLANIGAVYRETAAFTRAMNAWDQAWALTKDSQEPYARAVADYAISNWLEIAVSFGQADVVRKRLEDLRGRNIRGSAGARLAQTRETAQFITKYPERVIASGPEAIRLLLERRNGPMSTLPTALASYRPSAAGTSLAEVGTLARAVGLRLRPARRLDDVDVPVPSILHWKLGHFSPILERRDSQYRIQDVALGGEVWISRSTLLDQSSGYFLVPDSTSEATWASVSDSEAATVIGHSCPPGSPASPAPPPAAPPPNPECNCGGGGGSAGGGSGGGGNGPNNAVGMATYKLDPSSASVQLVDIPMTYAPARGPAIMFRLTYQQRDLLQPEIFTYANVGPMWSFEWQRFLQEVPQQQICYSVCDPAHVWVHFAGSWDVSYDANSDGTYDPSWRTRAVVVRVSTTPVRYERRFPDGSVEVYAFSDNGSAGSRRIFLTDQIDPQGQALHFTWDAQFRLVAVTDAVGQVTTLTYANPSDPLQLTSVTDPFGRSATLHYSADGQLASITDVIGITSSFAYGAADFISVLTTPYGRTVFRHEDDLLNDIWERMVEVTDALGDTEHLEFAWETAAMAATAPASEVPTGFQSANLNLDLYNTFYWDKLAWKTAPGDKTKAVVTHWLVKAEFSGGPERVIAPHSIKRPLEGRVWYQYPSQSTPDRLGWLNKPSRVGRVLDDGSSQITETTYNNQGQILTRTDPVGRRTSYTYAANDIDLLTVRNTTGSLNDLLSTYGNYTAQHRPQTVTDAAGQTTTMTYDAAGQVLTVTNPKQEMTTYLYNTDGQLVSVTGPVTGAITSYTYDLQGRVRTVTDADDYTITTDYDVFNRPTRVTYPDGTYEETTYSRLDRATARDRLGRITRYYYDALRRLITIRDPLGHVVRQEWCTCGSLARLVDANGHATVWDRDLEGRVTREVRADSRATQYTYETTTSRLRSLIDPKLQVTTYTYFADDRVKDTIFTNEQIPTPDVSFTYDIHYGRLATMVDGTGTTAYSYHPVGSLGATRLASIDGSLTNDTITYAYDQLGRVMTRAVNGSGVTWTFDALGRVMSETNALGTFTYTYDGATTRVATLSYPNGQTSMYYYFGNSGDRRLQTIHHMYPGGGTLSKFDYTYNAVGNILSLRQQADATAVTWSYQYDATGRLVAAVKRDTDPQATLLQRYAYAYDPAGNRTTEQIDDLVMGGTYNEVNELVSQQPTGVIMFAGTVSEPAAVTVEGIPAAMTTDNRFQAAVPIDGGTNIVGITARDASGNVVAQQFQVSNSGIARAFTYDANGNLAADGTRTFEWNARDELVAVNAGTHRTEFSYNGRHDRTVTIERDSGVITSTENSIWPDLVSPELRDGATGTTTRAFRQGVQRQQTISYFVRDHLDSVASVTAQSGAIETQVSYDPYGRETFRSGPSIPVVGFTGIARNDASGLLLAHRRAYDTGLGRWLSEDPLGFVDGPNVYVYVFDNPVQWVDPMGLYGLQMLPPNGNLWNGSFPQDMVCSPPASGFNSNPCAKRCCEDHDLCYKANKCNFSSWLRSLESKECNRCNTAVAGCVLSARANPTGCLQGQCRLSDRPTTIP